MRKAPPDIQPEQDDRDDASLFRAAIGADRGKVRALPEAVEWPCWRGVRTSNRVPPKSPN